MLQYSGQYPVGKLKVTATRMDLNRMVGKPTAHDPADRKKEQGNLTRVVVCGVVHYMVVNSYLLGVCRV